MGEPHLAVAHVGMRKAMEEHFEEFAIPLALHYRHRTIQYYSALRDGSWSLDDLILQTARSFTVSSNVCSL